MAELVEVKEADDLAPCAEEHDRGPVGAEVDELAERTERLWDLQHHLGLIPEGESLQVRRRPVAEWLDGDAIAGRGGQAAEDLADVHGGVARQRGAHGHGAKRAASRAEASHFSNLTSGGCELPHRRGQPLRKNRRPCYDLLERRSSRSDYAV